MTIKHNRYKQRRKRRRQKVLADRRRRWRRLVRLAVVAFSLTAASVLAAPSDLMESPGGISTGEAPEGTELSSGDGKVSGQTGSYSYSVPIVVPPGRVGAAPSLSMGYSSQAPLYGGLAGGWTLGLPTISRDFSDGAYAAERWTSSLSGRELIATSGDLVPSGFSAYRSQSDASFARYQRGLDTWRVLSQDGSTLFFGEGAYTQGVVLTEWFPITRSIDTFGNEVRYHWEPVFEDTIVVELRPSFIEYSINDGASGGAIGAHARVEFSYGAPIVCSAGAAPVGSRTSYRSGEKRVVGNAPLSTITTRVADGSGGFRDVRRYDLSYDATASSCVAADRRFDSPSRQLASVTENARSPEGVWTPMPALTFGYGAARDLSSSNRSASLFGAVHVLPSGPRSGTTTPLGDAPDTLFTDMDGDGLADILYSAEPDAQTRSQDSRCYVGWRKNLGVQPDGTLALGAETLVAMPTVPWKNYDDGTWSGSPFYVANLGTRGPGEACTVVGQHTLESDVWGSTASGDCGGQAPCGVGPGATYVGAVLVYSYRDFNRDGLVDLVVGLESDPSYYAEPRWTNDPNAGGSGAEIFHCPLGSLIQQVGAGPSEHSLELTPLPPPPGIPPPPAGTAGLKPFSPCNNGAGDFGWNVYLNDGPGSGTVQFGFDVPLNADYAFVSDVPVQKQVGEPYPAAGGGSIQGQSKQLVDLDGDGYPDVLDLLKHEPDGSGTGATLDTWELRAARWNPSSATMVADANLWAFKGSSHLDAVFPSSRASGPTATTFSTLEETGRLIDIHGDGLPDLLEYRPITGAALFEIRPNRGKSSVGSWGFADPVAPGPQAYISVAELTDVSSYHREQTHSMRDVDGDGRPDIVTPTEIHWGLGEGWLAGSAVVLPQQESNIGFQISGSSSELWSIDVDWLDVDGDGLPERVERINASGDEQAHFYDLSAHGAPRGVLHSIDNGRGLTVEVTYAPHTDASVVTMGPGQLPSPTRVVSQIEAIHAHGGAPSATTSYHYQAPVWNQDEFGRWGFRGFDTVTSTGPSGAQSQERYAYDIDWSGRLAETLVYAAGSSNPATIATTEWAAFTTLGNVVTIHANMSRSYVCEIEVSGAPTTTLDEATCLLEDPLVADTAYGYLNSGGVDIAIVSVGSVEMHDNPSTSNPSAYIGRCSERENAMVYSATEWRVATTKETMKFGSTIRDDLLVGPELTWDCYGSLASHLETTYDSTLRVATKVCAARDSSDIDAQGLLKEESASCTLVDVDLTTGLTLRKQSAEGFHIDYNLEQDWVTGVTATTYDSLGLFPIQVENALGHTVTMTTDLGTGAGLSSYGPNPNQGGYQEIDGFGRTLHEWISIKDDPDPNQPYHYRRKRDVVYDDFANPATVNERPTRLLSNEGTLQNNSNAYWADITTTYDGQGRVIKVYEATLAGAGQDASTRTYSYDASGNLVSITTPDPVKQRYQLGDVVYTFGYDSLGRKTCSLGPDDSGVATIYAGRRVTTVEFGSDGGDCQNPTDAGITTPRSAGLAETDVFGRVIRVEERTDAITDTWTATLYEYDGNSNLATITREDAAHGDIITEMTHDFVGNRTQIDRHTRSWSYTYDRNGNMVTQTDPAGYMISVVHDSLDRPISRLVPAGALDPTEEAQLGVGETTYEYDEGTYGLGQLIRTESPVATVDYTYDARGNPVDTTRSVDLRDTAGANIPLVDSLTLSNKSWNAFNQPATVVHPSGRKTFTFYHRWPSVPRHVYVYQDDGKNEFYLSMRNAAGVAKRLIHLKRDGATTVYGRHVFYGHDQVGRLTQEYSTDVGDDKISQIASYYGTSEVATLQTQVGPAADTRNFVYSYDDQHQLTSASDDQGYTSSFTFTDTGRLTTAHVTAAGGVGTMVEDRNVHLRLRRFRSRSRHRPRR